VTELAPWAALVQRFGRCARYGGNGQIIVIDRRHSDESAKKINARDDQELSSKRTDADRSIARPYELAEVNAAATAIMLLQGAADPSALDKFEKAEEDKKEDNLLPRLYPYAPLHIVTRRELLDLFDTGPDLTGADIDISRFVREGDDRDVTVWWWPVPERQPHPRLRPAHDALCRVPVGEARRWLLAAGERSAEEGEPEQEQSVAGSQKARPRAWVWSYLDGNWERLEEHHIFPGQSILVEAGAGGYDVRVGFTGKPNTVPVEAGHARAMSAADAADEADEQEELSEGLGTSDRQYKTIATHGAEVGIESQKITAALTPKDVAIQELMDLAGIVHDVGKAHPVFAGAIRDRNGIPPGTPLAKAPKGRWHGVRNLYDHSSAGKRPGFRHELASALAILELVWRAHPTHPALQGGREEVLDATVGRELPESEDRILQPVGILAHLTGLDETALNLVLYLVMSHHGKVRATLPMSPRDQENVGKDGSLPLRGVRDGDEIPAMLVADASHEFAFPRVRLRLDPAKLGLSKRYGPSWVERVLALRQHYGSFQLAWLEALMRVADVRASKISRPLDSRLSQDLVEVQTTPDAPDRDADLRGWIKETVEAWVSRQGGASVVRGAKGPASPRTSAKRSRRGAS